MITVILTGANRGLGHELHQLLVEGSPSIQGIFISRQPLPSVREQDIYIQADFEHDDLRELALKLSLTSKVIVFINNAGTIEPIAKAVELDQTSMENALRVNCMAPLVLAQRLALEAEKNGGRLLILNISSGAARRPIKGWMAYCVSKAAAVMALDVLAAENNHIEVRHIDPGVMDTRMQEHIRRQSPATMPDVGAFQNFKEQQVLKEPKEVAEHIIGIVQDMAL
ncbi:SDR family NAD(P)-dependent oxidoreductase [Pusillimonas sp.]|uniref:SDR family NAD(P)-dependent oxidoreductase n=1 Tax=Pusillimonas sp. TaxID=3040095 RepID=UPI0029B05370|nr:SDR family NAD(P)-dependent oxidoreductase [Pusillimonas sp.]MDX3895328.1 SDR family NAD(P)-dependent oxidoreductase [Pusillimonas sp.]